MPNPPEPLERGQLPVAAGASPPAVPGTPAVPGKAGVPGHSGLPPETNVVRAEPVSTTPVVIDSIYRRNPWWRSRTLPLFALMALGMLGGLWLVYQPLRTAKEAGGAMGGAVSTVYDDVKTALKQTAEAITAPSPVIIREQFTSFISRIEGQSKLQVASHEGVAFARVSLSKWPWAAAAVEVRAPFTSTYVVSLEPAEWAIDVSDDAKRVTVWAPTIIANDPSVKLDRLETTILRDSWRISEEALVSRARSMLFPNAREESIRIIPRDVRPRAREAVETFVRNWVRQAAPADSAEVRIDVRFAGEEPHPSTKP